MENNLAELKKEFAQLYYDVKGVHFANVEPVWKWVENKIKASLTALNKVQLQYLEANELIEKTQQEERARIVEIIEGLKIDGTAPVFQDHNRGIDNVLQAITADQPKQCHICGGIGKHTSECGATMFVDLRQPKSCERCEHLEHNRNIGAVSCRLPCIDNSHYQARKK